MGRAPSENCVRTHNVFRPLARSPIDVRTVTTSAEALLAARALLVLRWRVTFAPDALRHRIAGDVADGKDRRLRGASLPVNFDEPALIHLCSGRVETGDRGVRTTADRNEHAIEMCATLGAFLSSSETASLFLSSFTLVTFVSSRIDSAYVSMRDCGGEIAIGARSSPSVTSTTVTFEPSAAYTVPSSSPM